MHQESLGDSSCVGHAPGVGRVERECAPAKPKGTKKGGAGGKIHYVKDNLTGKYQNVSSTPDRGREEKLTGGICQLLNQAWSGAERLDAEATAAGGMRDAGWEVLRRGERGRKGACPPQSRGILASGLGSAMAGSLAGSVPSLCHIPWGAGLSLGFFMEGKKTITPLPTPQELLFTPRE